MNVKTIPSGPDRAHAAETADPEALLKALKLLNNARRVIYSESVQDDARSRKLFYVTAYLEQQFNDACRFLMGDAL